MYKKIDINYYLELQRRYEDILLNVALHEDNYKSFSIKIENLFVDTCAFFDSLCQTHIIQNNQNGFKFKSELEVRNYNKKISGSEYFNIDDYQKLFEKEYNISDKAINLNCHIDHYVGNPNYFIDGTNRRVNFNLIRPFENWANSSNPDWWKEYTCLKHNRLNSMKLGNFKNLTFSLGATFIILTIKNESAFKGALLDKEITIYFSQNIG